MFTVGFHARFARIPGLIFESLAKGFPAECFACLEDDDVAMLLLYLEIIYVQAG